VFESDDLNDGQRAAAEHLGGPLLVVAGAGTGKTATLAHRVARLVQRGARPGRILLLTFTRRAAREMLSRARGSESGVALDRVWGGTFHSVANRLLRLHGGAIGLSAAFTVLDRSDMADLMDLVRGELALGGGERRFPRKDTLADIYSRMVDAQRPLGDVLERDFPWCRDEADGIAAVFDGYSVRKRSADCLDYDDLLVWWRALLRSEPTRSLVAERFDHVLVDEYQDTNAVQADILAALKPSGEGLMVVGDDAQAIYAFRAATVRNILEFPERFPGTTIVRLERNYRSTQAILDASNAVIAGAARRHAKTLWTERTGGDVPSLLTCLDEADQSDAVCRAVLEHREAGVPLHEQAVLFRTGHHSDLLEVELRRRNVPFVKYGGLTFLETAHVKDALAMLRIAENPRDEVGWFRVLQLLEGVGPATARRGLEELGRARTPAEAIGALAAIRLPAPALESRDRLAALLRDITDADAGEGDVGGSDADASTARSMLSAAAQLERVRRFLEPLLRRRYDDAEPRLRDLEQLEQVAAGFATRAAFVADLTIDPPSSTADLAGPPLLDEDYLVLSTIHSAKGGEWDVVHVIHAADGNIPSDMATGDEERIDEERRLFYVALTRARHALHVYFPLRYHRRNRGLEDRHLHAQLTRFLDGPARAHFERRSTWAGDPDVAPARADLANGGAGGPAGAVPVAEELAVLWSR
jgi:DNA helicase-2/ATP-dependent DNA helicase PcrA